jgi:subtilisin-like proprotein convertase family protein
LSGREKIKIDNLIMKSILTLAMAMATGMAAMAQPYSVATNVTLNAAIPDNNPSGLASAVNVSGLAANILNVTVTLDITGGYNGDLYAYLAGPNGGFSVLLNRSGVNSGSAFGYSDTGFNNVTFDDSASNPDIHFYQTAVNPNGGVSGGVVSGTWGSDGETANPQSAPGSFNSGTGGATLATFDNLDGNGQWTLFLADLAGGNQSTLVSWNLDVTTVPEPSALALAALGASLLAVRKLRRI